MSMTMRIVAIAGVLVFAAGCANRTGDATIAAYCADPARQAEDICKVHAEVESSRVTLGQRIDTVFGVATDARNRADRAQQSADRAQQSAEAVQMHCVTRTLRNQSTGQCDPGYTLTACTQTRYTTRAGGLSILREVNDTQCRFNTRVLEMQVRCCYAGPNPPPATLAVEVEPQPSDMRQPRPVS